MIADAIKKRRDEKDKEKFLTICVFAAQPQLVEHANVRIDVCQDQRPKEKKRKEKKKSQKRRKLEKLAHGRKGKKKTLSHMHKLILHFFFAVNNFLPENAHFKYCSTNVSREMYSLRARASGLASGLYVLTAFSAHEKE